MHDWTRVSAGTFHAFHNAWITHIQEALNNGILPEPYYALGEQRAGDFGPNILTLNSDRDDASTGESPLPLVDDGQHGLVAVASSPPDVHTSQEAIEDIAFYLERQRSVSIRHSSGDKMIAIIEIVSRSNRHSQQTLHDSADKILMSLGQGIHAVVIDPFPRGRHDPHGIHGLIWERMLAGDYQSEAEKQLTLVSYTASHPIKTWIEPYAVGDALRSMPLFLTTGHYVPLPLETTYQQAWAGVPSRWKRVIEEQS